ncbi:MAG TPA: DUF192 domain-containing protein [Actinomycetota bacterium]|nr:DUF192 domain-containing protein [Actinomycetota bacterium]
MGHGRIIDAHSGAVLADDVRWADSFGSRLRGLVGTAELEARQAIVLPGVSQIHTIGMTFPIDALFCDASWEIHHMVRVMRPWRISRYVRSSYVIELRASAATTLNLGDVLVYQEDQEDQVNERYAPSK